MNSMPTHTDVGLIFQTPAAQCTMSAYRPCLAEVVDVQYPVESISNCSNF